MDYTEILRLQAKSMLRQLARESKNAAYEDERLVECIHGAFCIIRNDSNAQLIAQLLIGQGINFTTGTAVEQAQMLALVRSYVTTFAKIHQIPLPIPNQGA